MAQPPPELTSRDFWDDAWARPPHWRLPSKLIVSTVNLQRVIARYVRPGMRYLEVGCAPGKLLAWVASELHAEVSGLDYSASGIEWAQHLFEMLRLRGDLRCESIWATTFEPRSFDVVFSSGLIEHFDDPRDIVRAHLMLLKPRGRAIITVPNYGGVYGRLQRRLDPENLGLHNLSIMTIDALKRLAPPGLAEDVTAYPAGRLSPGLLHLRHRYPTWLAAGLSHAMNVAGLLQPVDIAPLCPMLVLEIVRSETTPC